MSQKKAIFEQIYIDREVVVQEAGAACFVSTGGIWVNEPLDSFFFLDYGTVLRQTTFDPADRLSGYPAHYTDILQWRV